jgi:hypothetical protein
MPETPPQPLPAGIPDEALPFLQEMRWLDPDPLQAGDPAPDLPLYTPERREVRLRELWSERPAALIFGSYT